MSNPLLAITMGDPSGVGPEIIAGAWSDPAWHEFCSAVVIGHPEWMRRAAKCTGAAVEVVPVETVDQVRSSPDRLPCLQASDDDVLQVPASAVDARGGRAAYEAVTLACRLGQAGAVGGIVTAPLNKAALSAAGYPYPGHTELLAHFCGVRRVAMMLYLARGGPVHGPGGLGVAHVTLHTAIRDVFAQLTAERVLETTRLAHTVMTAMLSENGVDRAPRIGVCALNPHAGEQQLFGDEEVRTIQPAVDSGRKEGLHLEGPLPADTLFAQAAEGRFDGVVAMYHDQGHIALKLLGMHRAVNITLGLPIVRTSVAHGTAFDLAWKGRARCDGMIEAIRVASQLVRHKEQLVWDNLPAS